MKEWLKDNWARITVGILLVLVISSGLLYFLGVPLWEASKRGIGDFEGQIVYSRTMKDFVDLSPRELVKEVFILDMRTGRNRQLTDHGTVTLRPEILPQSPWLAYTSFVFHAKEKIKNADLFVYNLLTRERKVLSYKKGLNLSGSFAPDGREIYYTIRQGRLLDVFRIGIDGRGFKRVTRGRRASRNSSRFTQSSEPAISPEGDRMAFVSDRDGRPTLYIRDLKTGNDVRILFAGVYNTRPRWSRDGRRLVFQGYLKGHFDIFVIEASGKNLLKISRSRNPAGLPANNESPDFSPDGKHIVFTSDRTGYNQIYVIDVDGKNTRRLTFDTFHYYQPKWIPKILPTENQ